MKNRSSSSFSSTVKAAFKDIASDAINSFHYWRHNLRGNRVGKNYFSGNSDYPPVILLQGFMGTRGVLGPLEEYLRNEGRDVISIDLGFFNIGDIRTSSQLLSYKIERILDRFSDQLPDGKVDIVGHSMGGLIGLHYVKRLGGHRTVRKLITLGAPFNGTWAALLGVIPLGFFSKSIWQMLPGSPFLESLNSRPDEVHRTNVISIAAKYDTICPPTACELEGSINHIIPVGHAGLLLDPRVYESISHFLGQAKAEDSKVVSMKRRKLRT